jgi:hypothetical protein
MRFNKRAVDVNVIFSISGQQLVSDEESFFPEVYSLYEPETSSELADSNILYLDIARIDEVTGDVYEHLKFKKLAFVATIGYETLDDRATLKAIGRVLEDGKLDVTTLTFSRRGQWSIKSIISIVPDIRIIQYTMLGSPRAIEYL